MISLRKRCYREKKEQKIGNFYPLYSTIFADSRHTYILFLGHSRYRLWLISMEAKSGKISYRVCHLQAQL